VRGHAAHYNTGNVAGNMKTDDPFPAGWREGECHRSKTCPQSVVYHIRARENNILCFCYGV
jgi:hypothetical protein